MDQVGLGDAVRALGTPPAVPSGLRTPDGRWLLGAADDTGPEFVVVHRAELHRILTTAAPPVRPATVTRVDTPVHSATVVTDTGETTEFDLVIGADGVGSAIRRTWPEDPGIRYAGYTDWRGVTDGPFETPAAGETLGRGGRFGIAPMPDGRIYWYATASAPADWRVPDERAELIRRFGGRHEPIPALVHAARADAVRRNDILDLAAPLSTLVHGRVALGGDAAHAMTPDLGQGGNQALEDAVTLAALVAREPGIDAALARYDTTRRARTAKIARRSRQIGSVAQARGRLTVVARDTVLRLTPATRVARAADRLQAWCPPS